MRSVVSADLRLVTTSTGSLAGVAYAGVVTMVPDDGLARLATAETGVTWVPALGEVVARIAGDELAVSCTPLGDRGAVTVTRSDRVVFTGSGDLAEVLRVAAAWRRGEG